MVIEPIHHPPATGHRGVVAWQWTSPMTGLSSAAVGGGTSHPDWLVNIGVPLAYDRTDLTAHATEIAVDLGLAGSGIALFTAADVSRSMRRDCDGVVVEATVGISKPTWAAGPIDPTAPWEPGTINVVVQLPVGLEPGAAVNAVMTATEAKTQALHERGIAGTGTASDAVVIVWPTDAAVETFAGPRSIWGSRIARATHAAVEAGVEAAP